MPIEPNKSAEGSSLASGLVDDEASEKELIDGLTPQKDYKPLMFEDPIEMLFYIDENLAQERLKLHPWQIEEQLFLSNPCHTFENRLKHLLTAANGSGKDAYILAPFAVWQLTCKVRSRFIGTSKSAHQLNTQTNPYIKSLAIRLGARLIADGYHAKPFIYRTKPFHLVCNFTGAEIITFVTDEAENVEGYHPWPDAPKADLTVAINEAKGVPDEYFDGFSRCTYNRWIEITSPGRRTGRNWEHYNSSVRFPEKYVSGKFYSRKITSYDCPHKSVKIIEEDAEQYGGKDSELFRSKHLAEYTSIEESVVLPLEMIDKWLLTPPPWDGRKERRGGLDLSLGGDETVLVVREGNKTLTIDGTRIRDATLLEAYLDKLFSSRGLTKKDPIFTDVGGLGKPIADTLMKMGWRIVAMLNNNPAIGFDKNLYMNRGTEMYFETCNWFARGYVVPCKDALWREQLGSRKYIRMPSDKFKMQPKIELKKDVDKRSLANSALWESPDRADAWVLAFSDFEPLELKNAREAKNKNNGRMARITQKQLIANIAEERFAGYKTDGKGLIYKPTSNKQREALREMIKNYGK
jgi:hypothetical protein